MTARATSSGGRWPGRGRAGRILLLYIWWLALCPHVVLTLAVAAVNRLGSRTGEFGSIGLWLLVLLVGPLAWLYLMPVTAVVGGDHLRSETSDSGLLVFGGFRGHAEVLLVYTVLAVLAATAHVLIRRSRRRSEPVGGAGNQPANRGDGLG